MSTSRPLALALLLLAAPPAISPAVFPILAQENAPGTRPFAAPDALPSYMPARDFDLRHLRLDLAFDPEAKSVSGTATNTLTPLRPGTGTLVFHAVDLKVSRVRLGDSELPFSLDPSAETLTVRLDRPRGPEDELVVAIDYTAQPRAGLWFVAPDAGYPKKPRQIWSQGEPNLNRHWFPSWDYPNDRATTEMVATVPRPLSVVSNGRLAEVTDRPDGRRTFHWTMEQPHVTYLVSIVVADQVKVADSWNGIPIEYYVTPGREEQARVSFGQTPAMMEYFSTVTGLPYPFAKYAQTTVYDYMWGGMENITATTQTERTLHDARHETDYSSEGLVAHELAHQWFGDLITCRSWDHLWLNEGFADYMTAAWKGHAHGADELAWEWDDLAQDHLKEAESEYRRPLVTQLYGAPIRMFDAHSYQKGALVLRMVHGQLGEETWWRAVREYVARFANQTVTTADLQRTLEDVSGVSLGPLFDQYVHGAGHPELALRWSWHPEERLVRLHVEQTQRITGEVGFFSFPVEVALLTETGTAIATRSDTRRVQLEARRQQEIAIPSETRPRTVVFDPQGWMLKEVSFDKPLAEWIVQLESAPPLAARLEALRALGAMGGGMAQGQAEAALGRALREQPFYGARVVAAEALGKLATPAALEALRPGVEDKHSKVRTAALEALGSFPDRPEPIAILRRAVEREESHAARAAAAKALGKFRGRRSEAILVLVRALGEPTHRDVLQEAALASLAELDAPETFDLAVRYARWGAPSNSREDALKALARWAAARRDPKTTERARKVLEGYLTDPVYLVRNGALDALGDLGDPAAIPALERAARNEADDEQRLSAEEAIRTIGQKQAAERAATRDLEQRVIQLEREVEVLKAKPEGKPEGENHRGKKPASPEPSPPGPLSRHPFPPSPGEGGSCCEVSCGAGRAVAPLSRGGCVGWRERGRG